MKPPSRTRQDTTGKPPSPARRQPRGEPIGSATCPLKHTAGQRRAAAAVRAFLKAAWLWQYLTASAQRILEEWLLHAGWKRPRVAIYQATIANNLGLHRSNVHLGERLLYKSGYGKRHEWREGPRRHRRAIWLDDLLGLLLRVKRTSFTNRQGLLRHLIQAALDDPDRAARHLRRHPQAQVVWEAALGHPVSMSRQRDVVHSLKRERETYPTAEASLPSDREARTLNPPAPTGQDGGPYPSPSTGRKRPVLHSVPSSDGEIGRAHV